VNDGMIDNNDVATKIKKYIESEGITQTHLAKISNIKLKSLNDILNGRVKITVGALQTISKALKVPVAFFLTDKPEPDGNTPEKGRN
jgi:transcriptional regulator with XRE-family HTH domain